MESKIESRVGVAGALREIFTAHLGGEWPESMEVDYPAHDRSPYWSEKARLRAPRLGLREWHGTARNVPDSDGVERLVSFAPAAPVALSKRLSIVAAKADELTDPKTAMGEVKRARLLRPVMLAVSSLLAKAERADKIEARRNRAKARAA